MRLFEEAGRALVSGPVAADMPDRFHADAAPDHATGLDRPVASGQLSFAFLHELLARQFGADFRQGGRLAVTFLKPVGHGDILTAHGVVTNQTQVDQRTRLTLEVWLEDPRGEKTSVGQAEVTIPSPLT